MQGHPITPLLSYQISGALKELQALRAGKCPYCGEKYIALPAVTTVICIGCGALLKPEEYKTAEEVMKAIGLPPQ